jgi:hypothetical protein
MLEIILGVIICIIVGVVCYARGRNQTAGGAKIEGAIMLMETYDLLHGHNGDLYDVYVALADKGFKV